MTLTATYTFICYPVNALSYASSNSVTNTISNPFDGLTSATAAPSAAFLAALGVTTNGTYWINLPTVGATQIYCILDRAVDGGGWMMAMKATRGTTFQYSANYWTTNNLLNQTDTTRNDADAKYNTMNYSLASDLLALWPDITTVGGSLNLTNASYNCWSWLQNSFTSSGTFYTNAANSPVTTTVSGITAAMTIIDWFTKISSVRYFIQDAVNWPGWGNTNTTIFSGQTDVRFYGFNYTSNRKSRWGFGWNENGGGLFPYGNMGSDDVTGGIGTDSTSYSAGDVIGCCQNRTGFNRSARVEIYIRDSSSAPSAPTIGAVSFTGSTATISFTGVTGAAYYTAFSNTGGFSGSSTSSPITITGMTGGSYTFTVKASNASGTSLASAASSSVYGGQLLSLPSTGTTGASALILNSASTTISGITGSLSFMNGTYNSTGSGNLGGWNPYNLFDGSTGLGFHSPDTPYDGTTGNYNGAKSKIISGTTVFGEWMTINFPYRSTLTSYTLSARGGYDSRAPRDWSIGGSNDGVTWTLLNTQNGITTGSNTFTVSSAGSYSYYLLIVRGCKPGTDYMNLGEWIIFGSYTV
jgi:hypothetical protein